ncbi:hypothetical protein A3Q56_03003 [Intoshia linei]|uniref:Uncharacterized protein n=1 Tax=Intoshia linei TaxID=1819745 RepID=A0A177B4K1_9BILA|nr:hypothetical protein A3Q56_03003 [Intoshia linei]
MSILLKIFDTADRNQFLDLIYWHKQYLSLIIAVTCSILNLTGFVSFLLYLIVVIWLCTTATNIFNNENDEVGSQISLDTAETIKEAMFPSLSIFIIITAIINSSKYDKIYIPTVCFFVVLSLILTFYVCKKFKN